MIMLRLHSIIALAVLSYCLAPFAQGDDTPTPLPGAIAPRPLVDLSAQGVESKFVPNPNATQVTVAPNTSPVSVVVTIQPGPSKYPGVTLKPDGATPWDLTPFGHVEATITNLSAKVGSFGLRIDGASWQENSASLTKIKPGETVTAKVYFGYTYGQKGNPLKTSALSELLIVAPMAKDAVESFRIESIQAAGPVGEAPPIDPNTVRITPPGGVLIGPGAKPLDAAKNLLNKGGATASVTDSPTGQTLKIAFPPGTGVQTAGIKPEMGRWGLTDGLEVRAKVRNDGPTPVTPTLHVDSNGGPIEATADAPLAPGAETELVASYMNPKIWKNTPPAITADPDAGNKFTSNQVSDVLFSTASGDGERTLTVESIKADLPPYSAPDWLGKRPPVEGDWTQTFDEEFNGTAIDESKWNVKGDNYYDQRSHFSKDGMLIGGGSAKLHYEKKTGYQNDDPSKKQTDYSVGYLDTFGKWTQRYGYFESRMKLPTAPGLWPAFWLMPDRGVGDEHRNSTKFGGMEFDVMEFLSGWGPNRYNIAMHWDGYAKDHKSTGSDRIYVQPDKDGFITCGLLWTPGSLAYYCNGKEILHYESDRISNVPEDMMYTMPSGGWDALPLDDAKLPDDLVIDYVRVWQRKDLASAVDGPKTPPAPTPTPAAAPAAAPATP
jgi:beta-glucanase (GH16 family)